MTRGKALILAWLTLVFMLSLVACAKADTRVYVIYGQGGTLTSMGMRSLAARLAKMPGLTVTTHSWKYPNVIVNDIRRMPHDEKVILIGYSLGANATTWISNAVRRSVALVVAYDPSIYSYVQSAGGNVRRLLLYHNNGYSRFGHARIPGKQVETIEINEGHLQVDFDQRLHAITIAAVRKAMR